MLYLIVHDVFILKTSESQLADVIFSEYRIYLAIRRYFSLHGYPKCVNQLYVIRLFERFFYSKKNLKYLDPSYKTDLYVFEG